MSSTRHNLAKQFSRLADDFRGNHASFNSLAEQGGLLLARVAEFPDILPDDFRTLVPPAKYPPMTPPEQIGFARRTAWVMALTLAGKAGVLANPLRMKTISRDVGIVVSGLSAPDAELALSSARLCDFLADTLANTTQANPGAKQVEPQAAEIPAPEGTKFGGKLGWLASAMLIVQKNPHLSDAAIAEKVGRHKTTLSRNETYKLAAAIARGDKSQLPRGEKFGGDLEAFDDD